MENRTPQEDDGALEGPLFARTYGRDIFGPLDDKLPEVRVPADVKVDAMREATKLGLDLTGWLRELVYEALYGAEHIGMVYQKRAERVRGNARQRATIPVPVIDSMRKEQ